MNLKKTSELNRDNAYKSGIFTSQLVRIKELLKYAKKGITIGEISEITKLPKSTVSGRIGDLKQDIVILGSKLDTNSKKTVTVWWLKNETNSGNKKCISNLQKLKDIEYLCKRNDSSFAHKILDIISKS